MALVSLAALVAGARAGKVISFPTDTVPALAAIADQAPTIFALKQRPPDKPLILMAANLDVLWDYVAIDDLALPRWIAMAKKYFPGAVTLVLPANERGQALNLGLTTLGMRIPDSAIALAVLQQTGALLTTSANLSGQAPLQTMTAIAATFPEVLTLATDYPDRVWGSGQPSTVVAWQNDRWQVLRQGSTAIEDG